MDERQLDRKFKEGLNAIQSYEGVEKSWSALEADLNRSRKKKRKIFWYFLGPALALLGIFYIVSKDEINLLANQESITKELIESLASENKYRSIKTSKEKTNFRDKINSKETLESKQISEHIILNENISENNISLENKNFKKDNPNSKDLYISEKNENIEYSVPAKLNVDRQENRSYYSFKNEKELNQMTAFSIPTSTPPSENDVQHTLLGSIHNATSYLLIPERKIQWNFVPSNTTQKIKDQSLRKWDIGFEAVKIIGQSSIDYSSKNAFIPKIRFEVIKNLKVGLFAYKLKEEFALNIETLGIGFPIPDDPLYIPSELQSVQAFKNNFRVGLDMTYEFLRVRDLGLSFKSGVVAYVQDKTDIYYRFDGPYIVPFIEASFINRSVEFNQYFIGSEIDFRLGPFSLYGSVSYNSSFPNVYFRHQYLQLGFGARYSF